MEKAPLRHVNGLGQCLGIGCPIPILKIKTNPSNKTKLIILSRELPNELKVPFSKLFFFFFFLASKQLLYTRALEFDFANLVHFKKGLRCFSKSMVIMESFLILKITK